MVFWSVVLGIIAVVLLLAWLSDRRRRGGPLRNRRRSIEDSVVIEQGKQELNRAGTDRARFFGPFRP